MQFGTQLGSLGRNRTLAPRHPSLAFKFPLFVLALLLVLDAGAAVLVDASTTLGPIDRSLADRDDVAAVFRRPPGWRWERRRPPKRSRG